MSQFFPPSANTIARLTIFGGVFFLVFIFWIGFTLNYSDYSTQANVPREQPVQFSHEHHVGGLGIDCRYCHTSVEESSFAGIPPTQTCMNCHSQIWANSPYLAPVRDSWRTGKPLVWKRIHNLADFVYFNHSIHIKKGVGCVTCHGRVDRMPLMQQEHSLLMIWCLDCHRHPERFIRPREYVFHMDWEPPTDQLTLGRQLIQEYRIRSVEELTSCNTCHR